MTGEESPDSNDDEDVFEFDCPECGTHIVGLVSICPHCRVEFIIEEVEEFECPECGELLSPDATVCKKCGVEFEILGPDEEVHPSLESGEEEPAPHEPVPEVTEPASQEPEPELEGPAPQEPEPPVLKIPRDEEYLKQEFPRLVAEVKPMLALAREFGVDTSQAMIMIDKAVASGKQGDLVAAIDHVRGCIGSIEAAIRERIDVDIKDLENLREVAIRMGSDPTSIEESLMLSRRELDAGDLKGALTHSREGLRNAETCTGKYIEAQKLVREVERLIINAERFYIDVSEVKERLDEARSAERNGDYSMMGIMARKGREQIMTILPQETREEMKRAKMALLDAKAEGKDVSLLVKILKEAASSLNRERYDEALEKLVEFRSELRHL